jgi:hypothetical protein
MELALSVCSPLEGNSTFLVSCTLRRLTRANNTALPQLEELRSLRKRWLDPVNPGSALEDDYHVACLSDTTQFRSACRAYSASSRIWSSSMWSESTPKSSFARSRIAFSASAILAGINSRSVSNKAARYKECQEALELPEEWQLLECFFI